MIIFNTFIWIEYLKKNKSYFKYCTLVENIEILSVECIFGKLFEEIKNENMGIKYILF
jgi:hypothetical protein